MRWSSSAPSWKATANDPGFSVSQTVTFRPTAVFTAHPYHWPTIGWTKDVEAAAEHREVIYKYYTDHYVPSNAVVVMVGDFDTKKAVSLCQQYFGVYPAGKAAAHYITPEPPQTGERRSILKRPGTTGHVLMGFHEPGTGTPDHYVMEVISQILSGGRSARLNQDLVDSGTATVARASVSDHKDPYLFEFEASPGSDVTNAEIEEALNKEITQLQTTPVTAEELARAVRRIEARFVFDNDSVTRQAGHAGSGDTVIGNGRSRNGADTNTLPGPVGGEVAVGDRAAGRTSHQPAHLGGSRRTNGPPCCRTC